MPVTEITLVGGHRLEVEGEAQQIEASILSAARGSIMELAWMTETKTGERIGINPDHVLMLRALNAGAEQS
jgi:hypothetical protein